VRGPNWRGKIGRVEGRGRIGGVEGENRKGGGGE
jgi:hypothetical protein